MIDAVGVANANDILFSARVIRADKAKSMGLVHRVISAENLTDEVMTYATNVSTLSQESLRVTKSMITAYRKGQRLDTAETTAQFQAGFSSKDFGEGFRAFLEKRKPDFS